MTHGPLIVHLLYMLWYDTLSCDVTYRGPRLSYDGLLSISCLQTRDLYETRTKCLKEFEPYPLELKLLLY